MILFFFLSSFFFSFCCLHAVFCAYHIYLSICLSIYRVVYLFVASLRNFGERTANLFRSKKKHTEQNAQDLANQTEDAAASLKNDLKNDANEVADNTG